MLSTQAVLPLSESDILMFLQVAPSRPSLWRPILTTLVGGGGIAAAIFLGLNIPAYLQVSSATQTVQATTVTPAPNPSPSAAALASIPAPTPTPTPVPGPQIPDNTVVVPSVGISAPISWNISASDDKLIHAQLEQGVIQIAGSALPGQHGMVAISGHSSNYVWDKGQYNTIFAPLHKVKVGDEIDVSRAGTTYVYKVSKIYQVKPTEVSVLSDNQDVGVRLITCTPIGTALRRLVVEAVQVSPNPDDSTAFTPAPFSGNLPATK